MTKVYIIRHAEAEGNLYRRVHGVYDSLITDAGCAQIKSLAKRFEGIHLDAVYSSDLVRTKQTASAVYIPKKLPLYTTERLREVNMGAWEDVPWGDIEYRTPELLYTYNHDTFNWRVEGCETFDKTSKRMLNTVKELAAKHEGEAIALVTHGSAIRALLFGIMGLAPSELDKLPYSDNTAVSLIEAENGALNIVYYNDNSHLPEGQSTFAKQHWWKSKGGLKLDYNMSYEPMDLELYGGDYADCYADAWLAAHGSLHGFDEGIYTSLARERAKKHPGAVMQSLVGGKPAGIIDLDIDADAADNAGSIAFYYMRGEYRCRGIGVQLLGYATSVYRALGRDVLRLRVAKSNKSAIRFYERYGFEKKGEQEGTTGKLLVMEKNIKLPEIRGEIKL